MLPTLPASDSRVSRDLHQRILDTVEDRQYTSNPARSRLIAVGIAVLVVAAVGLAQLQQTRSDALAAAAPTITDLTPSAGATEVGLDGVFRVQFGRRPIGTPTIAHQPPDGRQHLSSWDGTTLLVDYSGLRYGARYEVVVDAQDQSTLHDTGHFQKRWTFVAEGPPRLARTEPADGAKMVQRYGVLAVDFTRRPPSEPVLKLQPSTTIGSGSWSGSTWTVRYSDLQPLSTYVADVTVSSGDPTGRIHQTWQFSVEPGAPPAGVPVVWYSTSSPWQSPSSNPTRLVALDWTGAMVGTLYANAFGRQNPEGSWLSMFDGTGALDRQGHLVPERLFGGAVWSDAGNRYCNIGFDPARNNATSPQWLETGAIGGSVRRVATLGTTQGGQGGFTILSCSTLSDRAVVGDQTQAGYLDVRVMALSTGRILYSHAYANNPQMLVGSRDGRYLAESTNGSGPAATVIHRLSDGTIVARFSDQRVVAFSWDGSLVITAPSWGEQVPGEIQLVDWRTGVVRWRLAGNPAATGQLPVYAMAQPSGTAFIVGVGNPNASGDADGLLLIQADGHAQKIVSGAVFPAGYSG
ncbi:MAG: Ig-like domain-containing protein [Candidatus Dormibacter sp.]